ncbi:MAG: cobyrinate a,c-diamide synthase [Betaproteobacteria bacterium]|nr:cobyrinate a,c-diamide synthase [Betaproteobacteria bacterium]
MDINPTPFSCPALLIAGCASAQGKTTVTAALARHHARAGRRVRVFKTGPDFIDPMLLEAASGAPVYNLDCWMVGIDGSRALLCGAAREADLILVEGAMGLYDGEPSSADLAATFGLPVAAVIDASAMAETFGAVAKGLKDYRALSFAGVIANRVAGPGHAQMLAASLPPDIPLLGVLFRAAQSFPERHLGLVQASELEALPAMLDALADLIGEQNLPPVVSFVPCQTPLPGRLLAGRRIAVARDAAFSFLYRANLDCLAAMGAELNFFSPLADELVPRADSLYLPGGYPELHAARLTRNRRWLDSLKAFASTGRPLLAECGGMMVLFDALVTPDGTSHLMAGLLPGKVTMRERLAAIGLQSLWLPQGELRGHAFHHSQLDTTLAPAHECAPHGYGRGEPVYRRGPITASYLHAYFPSNPAAAAALLTGTG